MKRLVKRLLLLGVADHYDPFLLLSKSKSKRGVKGHVKNLPILKLFIRKTNNEYGKILNMIENTDGSALHSQIEW